MTIFVLSSVFFLQHIFTYLSDQTILSSGVGGRRVQICGRLEPRLEIRTAAQVFFSSLSHFFPFIPLSHFCFVLHSKSGLHFKRKIWNQAPSLTIFCSELLLVLGSSASNCKGKTISWKKYSKYFLFTFPWRIERCTMSLLIFYCEATLLFQPSVSTGTHFHSWQLI